jgi:Flp pilus assembly protein TadD
MLKSPIRVLLLTVALMFALQPLQTVHGIILSRLELAAISAPDTPGSSNSGQGNGFLRALKAPFKAIGRLFGGGKKNPNKIERITAKDIKKFESAPANRVDNPAPAKRADNSAPAASPAGDARGALSAGIAVVHLEKGRTLLDAGNFNAAIAELSTAVSLDPKLSEAHTLLGVAYERKGLNDMARQSLEAAMRDQNDQAMHLNNLGYLAYTHGEYKEAIKYLKRATKLAPNDSRIWNNLGLAQADLGKFDDAYKSFTRAGGEFFGRLNVAARMESQGATDKAIKQLELARALQPNSNQVLGRLATLYDRSGQPEQAQKVRSALALLPVVADAGP